MVRRQIPAYCLQLGDLIPLYGVCRHAKRAGRLGGYEWDDFFHTALRGIGLVAYNALLITSPIWIKNLETMVN